MAWGPVFNPANAVTASRFLFLPAVLHYYDAGNTQLAAVLIVFCALVDKLDGLVAKLCKCQSGFGELFDAITDGICYSFFLVIPAAYGHVPWLPVLLILGAGALNSAFRAVYVKRVGRATNYHSHAMFRCVTYVAYTTGLVVAGFQPEFFLWTCSAFIVLVVIHDSKRMLIDPVEVH